MNSLKSIGIKIYDRRVRPILYAIREWWPFWYHVLNRRPRRLFLSHSPALDSLQSEIVATLERDGIATTNLDALFPQEDMLSTLLRFANSLPKVDKEATRLKKKFLEHLWETYPTLDLNNPFLEISLRPRVLDIANSYLGMWTKLKYYDLAITLPVGESTEPVQSQRWHRDPEEKRMVKMFIYLSDVDADAGPFTYVPRSIYAKKYGHLFPQRPPAGSYPPIGEVEKMIPLEDMQSMTGKAGTVIFCDTTGLHRGGYAKKKERTMYTAPYNAPTYSEKPAYKYPENFETLKAKLSPAAAYALEK